MEIRSGLHSHPPLFDAIPILTPYLRPSSLRASDYLVSSFRLFILSTFMCISGLKREHTCDADSIRKIVSSQLFGGVWRGRGGRANTHSVAVVSRPWLVPTLPLLLRFRDRQTTAVCPVDMFVCVCGHCVSHWCHWQRNVHIIRAYIRVGGGHHSTFEHEKKILVLHTADGLFVRWGRWSSVEPQNDVF